MVNFISKAFYAISDQGDVLTSKLIYVLGIAGIGGGGANFVAQQVNETQSRFWLEFSHYAAVVSVVAALTLIIKNVADMYYSKQSNKRKEEEAKRKQEKHDRDMNKPAERIGE